ncbi:CDP-6-deoxy-delta-3,4-glucoseen reductase [Caballeronia udeis]|uniref:CDP-6-deoxy-delta-3,4-glucoseen reductase n=1 Tax=Caballeronia udeis TaxID=1232866 RepID=A0A158GJY8_9BURK|nr:2Fe-2S iron-sulfur cluster-binding protein [Caballeronia udeis]SAL32121.1 CDP-6-deoxy-delta-3,4-glucoseen reductase [Caballeronia udeis]
MSQHKISVHGEDRVFLQSGNDTILRAALRSGIGFPYECNSGGCGSCKFELVTGDVESIWPEAPGLTERDRRKGRLLACQCRAKSALGIKIRTDPAYEPIQPPKRRSARFVESHDVTHDIREFRFVTEDKAAFLAGQYAMLSIPGVTEPRAYSMSNIGNELGEWQFQIRRVPHGRATERLFHHLHAGDEVEIDGGYGVAFLRTEVKRDIVCVAGGSGLAPMVSIARAASQLGMLDTRRLHFFYGGRTPADICGTSFLSELKGYDEQIHFYPVVSLPNEIPGSQWSGETGYVHDAVQRVFEESLREFEFYFAGPPPMTQTLQEMLMVGYKVPFDQIHFDRFF